MRYLKSINNKYHLGTAVCMLFGCLNVDDSVYCVNKICQIFYSVQVLEIIFNIRRLCHLLPEVLPRSLEKHLVRNHIRTLKKSLDIWICNYCVAIKYTFFQNFLAGGYEQNWKFYMIHDLT